jgi:translation initiation factor 2B subunit (eIF-2B alpha/beta/delta family)
MDPDERVEALVAPLRADVVSGASAVARTAAEVIRRAAVRASAGSLEELRWGLGRVSRRVLDAQPSMAPLVQLVRDVLDAVDAADSVEAGRLAAANAADAFRAGLETRAEAVAASAADLLPAGGRIATVSSSSTVRAALLRDPRSVAAVVCFEGRPMNEGRTLASQLAEGGLDVTYAVDAAMHGLIPSCDALLMGADSIGDMGVVNKIGSAGATLAAVRVGVPVYVLADETKILPRGFPQTVEDDRPGKEVWDAPRGVKVWNRYFEAMPLEHVTGVVTENAVLSPKKLERMRAGIEFPEVLRRWAAGRG